MSDHQGNHPDPATQAVAVLTACIVQTLASSNPTFLPEFEKNLGGMYSTIRDNSYFHSNTLQAVALVRDLLKT